MNWKTEWKMLSLIAGVFLLFYFFPFDIFEFYTPVQEALLLTQWYAQEHVILCLLPAFFIAGAISTFIRQQSVMKYLGAKANKILSYAVASVSGGILAVCSCTVLPLFAGIYRMGAGLGPATAFLYSGPAVNVMAIILTANVLGFEIGVARAIGAVVFSVVIGVLMHFIFRKEELDKSNAQIAMPEDSNDRPLWKNAIYFGLMVLVLVFSTWGNPEKSNLLWSTIFSMKWYLAGGSALALALVLYLWFEINKKKLLIVSALVIAAALMFYSNPLIPFIVALLGLSYVTSTDEGESKDWFDATWDFAKQIMPLLFYGVLIAGFALGRPGGEGIIPSEWISASVGDNDVISNLFASVVGAFMYFATLTEIPILQGLIGNGMAKGPALALLLSGPALSLPNMLVIKSVIGWKKTLVYIILVVVMSSLTGLIYGNLF